MAHIPVLLNEVMEILEPGFGKFMIDGTTDGGGHLAAIIERMEVGKVMAIDWDKDILQKIWVLRKLLYPMDDLEAMEFLLDKIKATKNNADFFDSMRRG